MAHLKCRDLIFYLGVGWRVVRRKASIGGVGENSKEWGGGWEGGADNSRTKPPENPENCWLSADFLTLALGGICCSLAATLLRGDFNHFVVEVGDEQHRQMFGWKECDVPPVDYSNLKSLIARKCPSDVHVHWFLGLVCCLCTDCCKVRADSQMWM